MLRTTLVRGNLCLEQGLRAGVRRQWQPQRIWRPLARAYADETKPVDKTVVAGVPTGPLQATVTSNPAIAPTEAPKVPPTPTEAGAKPPTASSNIAGNLPHTGSGTASTGPASVPPPPPKKPRRRFRNFLLTLVILSALGYAGGVYYSLVSDNFHDFFTEYIPFAEDVVGYFEEREFRRRFPTRDYHGGATRSWPQTRGEQKVTIARQSGLSPRVASEGSENENAGADLAQKGRHMSSVEENAKKAEEDKAKQQQAKPKEDKKPATKAKDVEKKTPAPAAPVEVKQQPAQASKPEAKPTAESASPAPTVKAIDHVSVPEATEPAVQDVVKLVNNIITAVNNSPEASKFTSILTSAKDDLNNVISNIQTLKDKTQHDAETKIQDAHKEFDEAAKELVKRLEGEMKEQEVKWREEYENEREKLSFSYQQKLAAEVDAMKKVQEQKVQNQLLEQEIAMQKSFMDSVKSSVEAEREGRLAKLDDLSSSVAELETLTSQWNEVVDATLWTQHLHVALDALRAKLLDSNATDLPSPFLNELLALKEVSADDEVVTAAIASIPPVAYQRGIPSPAALIDRFRRVSAEVRKASLLPEDAGVASHAASAVLSRLMFTKKSERGLPEGDDVEATLARTEVLLEEGDLDGAAREMNGLQGWAGVLSRDWVAECRRVLEVQQAVEVIATEARLQSLLVE